ncbi:MAG: hypothetical protein ACPGXY_03590 [Alphaproteobacteria bacterium]
MSNKRVVFCILLLLIATQSYAGLKPEGEVDIEGGGVVQVHHNLAVIPPQQLIPPVNQYIQERIWDQRFGTAGILIGICDYFTQRTSGSLAMKAAVFSWAIKFIVPTNARRTHNVLTAFGAICFICGVYEYFFIFT